MEKNICVPVENKVSMYIELPKTELYGLQDIVSNDETQFFQPLP